MRRRARAGCATAAAAVAPLLAAACTSGMPTPAPAPPSVPTTPAPRPATAQYRFEIVATADTTFAFVAPSTPWLAVGQKGIVVDPRRRDVLVARFEALRRGGDTVIALVTGQTARLAPEHVVVVPPPPPVPPPRRPFYRQRTFWVGLLTGGALGAGTAIVAR